MAKIQELKRGDEDEMEEESEESEQGQEEEDDDDEGAEEDEDDEDDEDEDDDVDDDDEPGPVLWAAEVEPGTPTVVGMPEGRVLLLTMASLGENAEKGERAILRMTTPSIQDVTVCALSALVQECVPLDLPVSSDGVIFEVVGAKKTSIHLVGRFVEDYEDYDDEEDEEDEEHPEAQLYRKMMAANGQLEDGDDEESDDEDYDEEGEGEEEDEEEEEEEEEEEDGEDEEELSKKLNARFPGRSGAMPAKAAAGGDDEDEDEDEDEESSEDEPQQPVKGKGMKAEASKPQQASKPPHAHVNGGKRDREGESESGATPNKKAKAAEAPKSAKSVKSAASSASSVSKADFPSAKVDPAQIEASIKSWLKEAKGQMDVSEMGTRISKTYQVPFKKLGMACSLNEFIAKLDGVAVANNKVVLK